MTYSLLLGRDWDEVRAELEQRGINFSVKYTRSPRVEPEGNIRVVRIRMNESQLELVLASENFSSR